MTAIEDPAMPLNLEAPEAAGRGDDLEHWLTDLRSDLAADPPGWIDADPNGAHPASHAPGEESTPKALPSGQPETTTPEAGAVGRHRTLG
jgi:hypothetical protein